MSGFSFYITFLISLIFIIALCSTVLSLVYESIAYFLKDRGTFLKEAIKEVLNDTLRTGQMNLTELFYAHPQIDLTKKTYRHLPSYISSINFAQTLIDVLCNRYKKQNTVVQNKITDSSDQPQIESTVVPPADLPEDKIKIFQLAVEGLGYTDLQVLLNGFLTNAGKDLDKLTSNIMTWYDEYMNRVSGWYKMKVQKRLFLIGIALCIAMNMDFFAIGHSLITDKTMTEQIAKVAENYKPQKVDSIKNSQELQKGIQRVKEITDSLYNMNVPILWNNVHPDKAHPWGFWFLKLMGWLIMAIALSFGSPFWFDILAKLVNIRKSGVKPAGDS